MSKRRRVSGYRSGRGGNGGCVTLIVWLGILANIGLIIYTVGGDSLGTLAARFTLTPDHATGALQAFEAGNFDTAVTEAQAALAQNPDDTAAVVTLVRSLVYRSYTDFNHTPDLADALQVGLAAARAHPDNPDALAAHAFALQADGQPVAAAEVAENALALDENHTLARTALALSYARVGSFEIALRESQAAVAADANTSTLLDARRAVAISTADLGNYAAAGDLLDALIADYRRFIPLYYERALYARQVSQAAIAEQAYFTVLQLDETNVKARLRLCEFTASIGERDAAFRHCTDVTDVAPGLADGWYQVGRLHFLAGEFEQAQQRFNRCSTLQTQASTPPDERIFECWYLQGQAAEILGDCPALIATYNQFQRLATDPRVRETWSYPPEGPPMCQ